MTDEARQTARSEDKQSESAPAQIKFLYESRDGKLCLFEDAAGHLTAVPTAKLA